MNRENYQQVKAIFNEAVELTPEQRTAFITEKCGADANLRRAVEELLSSDQSEFLEQPAVENFVDSADGNKTDDLGVGHQQTTVKIQETTKQFEQSADSKLTNKVRLDDQSEISETPPDENELRPSRWRFALVCLLFIFVFGWNANSIVEIFSRTSSFPEFTTNSFRDKRFIIHKVEPEVADRLKIGDEIVGVNGKALNIYNVNTLFGGIKVGERFALQIKRSSETDFHQVELIASGLSTGEVVMRYLINVLLSATFYIVGLMVFLLKPNNKQAVLMALTFSATSMVPAGFGPNYVFELPLWFIIWRVIGRVVTQFGLPLFVHLALFFPERSLLARRFPYLEWLIYLPVLLFSAPFLIVRQLSFSGLTQFNFAVESTPLSIINGFMISFHLIVVTAILIFNYLKTNETGKRRIRIVIIGVTAALIPLVFVYGMASSIVFLSKANPIGFLNDWRRAFLVVPFFLVPITFSYAIVRHKVIPVSFIVRRSLQYLLAANALRLLLIAAITGVVWNFAANPSRPLDEILLRNSIGFYLCAAAAGGLLLLNRFGLRDFVDRQFFREQYNQDRILRELTEAVKNFDSLAALARSVSDKLAAALHPSSIYLFFQQECETDFSVSYTTEELGQNFKLPAASPLLQFLQTSSGAINFPSKQTDELPDDEKRWLREISANLLVPMHGSNGKLTGFFVLGEKKSEIPYTGRDRDLLETLAHQIALVQENLTLKDSLRREKTVRTQVLSRLDAQNTNLLKECSECGKCFDSNATKCTDDDGAELILTLPIERTIENRYRLEQLIGKGGMGAVYQAADLRLSRDVAVKILGGANFGNADALRRFEREAQIVARLQHRNIITVFDYGVLPTEGAFLVMEFVRGATLKQVLQQTDKLDLPTAIDYFAQVLDAAAAAHKAGIIHRDLKPDNVLVSVDENGWAHLRVLDFGLAKLSDSRSLASEVSGATKPGTVMGTFGYMSPEQLKGERVDERGDLFAVGAMIYESLQGVKPFPSRDYHELLAAMSEQTDFAVNGQNQKSFFERALASKPEKRFRTAAEMKQALSALI